MSSTLCGVSEGPIMHNVLLDYGDGDCDGDGDGDGDEDNDEDNGSFIDPLSMCCPGYH